MKILICGINYAPELTGIGKYTAEMAEWLAHREHDISVITAMPYYPEWKINTAYRRKSKWWHSEKRNGVHIFRAPLYVPQKPSTRNRILHEFSFQLSLIPIWVKFLFQKKYDLVICVTPPFHLSMIPLLYAKVKGAKLLTHIQDLQVDAAESLGMVSHRPFLNLMFRMERFLLKKSDIISTISMGMLKKVWGKNISQFKTLLLPNWVDGKVVRPLPLSESLRAEFGLQQSDRVILYSGNLGEKQGLDIIVEVARKFVQEKDVYFLIVGSGGCKEQLLRQSREAGLANVLFFPLQPIERMSALFATADVHLVLQKKSASDLVMPSKLTGIMAAGGCAVISAVPGSTLYDVVHTHQLGILITPESSEALYEGIHAALLSDREMYRKNALEYANAHLNKEQILLDFENRIHDILSAQADSRDPKRKNVPFL